MRKHFIAFIVLVAAMGALGLVGSAVAGGGGRPLTTTLTGAAEVPGPGDPDGSGTAELRLNLGKEQICYTLTVSGIAPATAAHIHVGSVGVAGPVVVPLAPPTSGTSSGCASVDRDLLHAIIQNPENYYVNVHNAEYPAGALRGQLGVQATTALRTVSVTFNVTVPASTDGTGRSVHIAGTLSRLDGGLPDWDPGAVSLTRVDATHWTITLTGKETTQIEYKYTLGDWDHVEKEAGCGEIANRQLTLAYGSNGSQTVNDTVQNWRNVSPCGN